MFEKPHCGAVGVPFMNTSTGCFATSCARGSVSPVARVCGACEDNTPVR